MICELVDGFDGQVDLDCLAIALVISPADLIEQVLLVFFDIML
jgi:hypothetical protein